ncbi:MAG: alginate lyase family protein [Verrucomicrobia bacterium]|nr:alginate lyase family protein [Verrucomicrobiota bacterium]
MPSASFTRAGELPPSHAHLDQRRQNPKKMRFVAWYALGLVVLNLGLLFAADNPLAGTKRGPTGSFLTQSQRQELRKRIAEEIWAKDYFEQEILPASQRGEALACGVAYVVTGQRAYAERARDGLLYGVKWWENRPKSANLEKPDYTNWTGGNCAWGVSPGAVGNVNMAATYDLVADALPPEEDALIRRTIKEVVDYSCNWLRLHANNPNQNLIAFTSLYEWAAAIGDEQMMDWLLQHRQPETNHGGVLKILDEYLRDHEISNEAPIYQTISLRVCDLAACAYRYDGRNLFKYASPKGNTIKGMLDGLIDTGYPITQTGIHKGTVCSANWGHGGTTYLGDIAVVNRPSDTWTMYSCESAIATLLRAYPQDKTYRYLMSLTGRATRKGAWELAGKPTLDDFLYGRLPVTDGEPAASAPSKVFPSGGVVMLRHPETPDYWPKGIAAWFHGGECSRGHMADPSLMIFGAGRLLLPQFLVSQYEDYSTTGWTMRRISRNTITIDGRDGLYSYTAYRYRFDPEVKFASLRCHPYLEAEMERIGMLTGDYLLDVFQAKVLPEAAEIENFPGVGGAVFWSLNGSLSENVVVHPGEERNFVGASQKAVYGPREMPASHTFDYTLHGLGRQFPDAWNLYQPSQEFMRSSWPNRWVMQERKRETDESFFVDWVQTSANYAPDPDAGEMGRGWEKLGEVWFKDRAGLRTRMLGAPGTKVFLAEGPMRWGPVDRDLTPEEILPFLAVRRTGRDVRFVAVHEPYKDRPKIQQFGYFHRPKATEPAVGVIVRAPTYTDLLFVCLGLPGERSPQCKIQEETPMKLPQVTVHSEDDPGSGIVYRGQAYVREAGRKLVVRGEVEAFSLPAPTVPAKGGLFVNGQPAPYVKLGDYVVFGQNQWKPGKTVQPTPAKTPWAPPLQASLPQPYVNIDADKGGLLVVRVENVVGPNVPGNSAAGRIEVLAEPPLAATPASQPVPMLSVGQRQEIQCRFSGGQSGRRIPIKIRLYVEAENGERLAQEIATDVSVGMTLEEIVQSYKLVGRGNEQPTEVFDRFRVRAPGYTLEVDKFSGTSRSMIDPDGHERIAAAGYPLQFSRGNPTFANPTYSYEVPCARGSDPKQKILGWGVEAKLLDQERDSTTGHPALKFQTHNGQYELRYLFRPEAVQVALTPIKEGNPQLSLEFVGLCVEHPTYKYRPCFTANEFGFRQGPYAPPQNVQRPPDGAYGNFSTCPRPTKPAQSSAAPRRENLLADGGLDAWEESRQFFQGWSGDATASASCALDTTVKHSGAASLRYDLTKGRNPLLTATPCPVRAGYRYRISLWMRFAQVRGRTVDEKGFSPRVPQSGYNNACLQTLLDQPPGWHQWYSFHPLFWPNGTRDWVKAEFPPSSRMERDGPLQLQLRLSFGECTAGTVWLDDVEVEEIN